MSCKDELQIIGAIILLFILWEVRSVYEDWRIDRRIDLKIKQQMEQKN